MKTTFLIILALCIPVLLAGGFCYLVWHACASLYEDWRLKQELAQLRKEADELRQRKHAVASTDPAVPAEAPTPTRLDESVGDEPGVS